jgi:hypothetical protein
MKLNQETTAVVEQTVKNSGQFLQASTNLSDVADPVASRAHLGLGDAATHAASDFDPAGAAAGIKLNVFKITGTNSGSQLFVVAAGLQPHFPDNSQFIVISSTVGNNGTYTVNHTNTGGNTLIAVNEVIPSDAFFNDGFAITLI